MKQYAKNPCPKSIDPFDNGWIIESFIQEDDQIICDTVAYVDTEGVADKLMEGLTNRHLPFKQNEFYTILKDEISDIVNREAQPVATKVTHYPYSVIVQIFGDTGLEIGSVAIDFEDNKLIGHCYLSDSDEPESTVLCADVEQERKVEE